MGQVIATAASSSHGTPHAEGVIEVRPVGSVWELTEEGVNAHAAKHKAIVQPYVAAHLLKRPPLAEHSTFPMAAERERAIQQTQQARPTAGLQPVPLFDWEQDDYVRQRRSVLHR